MSDPRNDYAGAKVLLFLGPDLLILRRDHTPGIPWPGLLDFPGGAREGAETPEACAIRETREETGLVVSESALEFVRLRPSASGMNWYFAAHLSAAATSDVVFGGEGAGWLVMTPQDYLAAQDAIPPFQQVLAGYLETLRRDA